MIRNEDNLDIVDFNNLIRSLPFFSIDQLSNFYRNKSYLRILLSRYENKGKLIRLKKGLYVAGTYIDLLEKRGKLSSYYEFIAGIMYKPSYLSFDYILYQHQILTEIPVNFTCATINKTMYIKNKFGNFFYHSLKKDLFTGYHTDIVNGWIIYKATKAKALFDFLYIRKNFLINSYSLEELRLNLEVLTKKDKKEIEKYGKLLGSKKINWILKELL